MAVLTLLNILRAVVARSSLKNSIKANLPILSRLQFSTGLGGQLGSDWRPVLKRLRSIGVVTCPMAKFPTYSSLCFLSPWGIKLGTEALIWTICGLIYSNRDEGRGEGKVGLSERHTDMYRLAVEM